MPKQTTPSPSISPSISNGISPWDKVLHDHLPESAINTLRTTHIGLIGAGGIGSNVALMLARSGIGQFTIADGDTVNLSNLNRQAYGHEHIGQGKVFALQGILHALRPDLRITALQQPITKADIERFASCDIILEAVDDPTTKRHLAEAFLLAGHRVVATSGMGGIGGEAMSVRRLGSRLYIVGDHKKEVQHDTPPMAPRVVMAAALQADTALSLLLGKIPV